MTRRVISMGMASAHGDIESSRQHTAWSSAVQVWRRPPCGPSAWHHLVDGVCGRGSRDAISVDIS